MTEKIKDAIKVVYRYRGKKYVTFQDYYIFEQTPDSLNDDWEYIYREGNYSCDCNRSLFIQRQCDPAFPDLQCGDKIKMISLEKLK